MPQDPSNLKPETNPDEVHTLPGVNSRSVLISIGMVAALAELSYAVMNLSAMPVYLKFSMGYPAGLITSICAAFLMCEGVMKGPFGIIGDRVGRKWLIVGGPVLSIFTSILTVFVTSGQWYFFVLLRVIDGFGAAALWPSALVMIADIVPENRRSQAMSMFNVTYMVGLALGPFIGGSANDLTRKLLPHAHDPRQASFYITAILFAITAIIAAWRIPDIRPKHEQSAEHEGGFGFKEFVQHLRTIPEMLTMAFVTFLGIGLIMQIIKLFAIEEFNISESQYGALLIIPCLFIGGFSMVLGTLGDRIGRVKAIRIGIGLCAISMWALIFIHSEWALVIGGSIIGIGFVISFPAWMAHVSAICDPRQRGAMMGAVGTAQGLGAVIGVPVGGLLYDHANINIPFVHSLHPSHYVPFIGCALLLIVAWLIATFIIKERPGVINTVESAS